MNIEAYLKKKYILRKGGKKANLRLHFIYLFILIEIILNYKNHLN